MPARSVDAVDVLLFDHSVIRRMFAYVGNRSKFTNVQRARMWRALVKILKRHETMEQNVWYPVLRRHHIAGPVIKHLLHEEKGAADQLAKFKAVRTLGPAWNAHFKKLAHDVEHHATEEETRLFPVVRKALDKKELRVLGAKMIPFSTIPFFS
jgi:iron-sulfur cluster repair protein YtfE (RIC family)